MTILNGITTNGSAPESTSTLRCVNDVPLHRIREVRQRQGVSLRSAARRMGAEASKLKRQEDKNCDLRLSDLYRWHQALEVPICELLAEERDELSPAVIERAQMVRLMKTAAAILEQSESESVCRMTQNLVCQLVEMMPELAEVSPWHAVGQRRSLDEYGRAFERRLPDEQFQRFPTE